MEKNKKEIIMLEKNIKKEEVVVYIMIVFVTILIIFLCCLDILFPTANTKREYHECVNFVKYQEHYQITPLSWNYRDSFKCIECGKDYKD